MSQQMLRVFAGLLGMLAGPIAFAGPEGGTRPGSRAADAGGDASPQRVIFLWDGSGSMLNLYDPLRDYLLGRVEGLSEKDSFNLVFFRDDSFKAMAASPAPVSPKSLKRAAEFLADGIAASASDPLPALRAVFGMDPTAICLMTNGDFPNNKAVLEEIGKLNKEQKVKVHTIAMFDEGREYQELLARIAKENGGTHMFLSARELVDTAKAWRSKAPATLPASRPASGERVGPDFMGICLGSASPVVFVCDASGSMMNKLDILRLELRRAIDALGPGRSFNIIFVEGDEPRAMAKAPVAADKRNRAKAADFLDRAGVFNGDPIAAVRMAFANRPEAICLVTDGDFPDNRALIEEIRKLNREKRVKVHTVALMDRGEEYEKALKRIAEESGGTYRLVTEETLKGR